MKPAGRSSDLERAAAFFACRFRFDEQCRIESAQAGKDSVPPFALVRTRLGCLWRFRADQSDASIRALSKLAGREGGVAPPFDAAAPLERVEPMLRVLSRAGASVVAVRELLLCRVGWVPGGEGASIARFGVDEDSDQSLAKAQWGWLSWERRKRLPVLEGDEWVCFGDYLELVEVA